MDKFDIRDKNGNKVGTIEPSSPWSGVIGFFIFVILLGLCLTQCEAFNLKKKIEKNDYAYILDLKHAQEKLYVKYNEEREWIESHYPDTNYNKEGDWTSRESYDSSFHYFKEVAFTSYQYDDSFHSSSWNYSGFVAVRLKGEYSSFEGFSFISEEQMELWEKDPNNYKHPGFCVIFGDGEVLYTSNELTPTGQLSEKISVNVEGVDKLVICVIGQIYLGAPHVLK